MSRARRQTIVAPREARRLAAGRKTLGPLPGELCDVLKDLLGMLGRLHLRVSLQDGALFRDQVRDSLGITSLGVVGRAVCQSERARRIAQQAERKRELFCELLVLFRSVEAHPEDHGFQ